MVSRENGTEVAQALSALGDTFHALALQFQNLADQLEPARKRWQDTEWAILDETHLRNPSAFDLLDFARSATEDPARVVYERHSSDRATYPNTDLRWQPWEETKLLSLLRQGAAVEAMVKHTGRTSRAISHRVRKIGTTEDKLVIKDQLKKYRARQREGK